MFNSNELHDIDNATQVEETYEVDSEAIPAVSIDYLQAIKEMFYMQANLNRTTNGESWLNGYTKHNRTVDWLTCFKSEMNEVLDCFPWKHWKNINMDIDTTHLVLEVVDCIHFGMSFLMETYYKSLVTQDENHMQANLTIGQTPIIDLPYDDKVKMIIDNLVTTESMELLYKQVLELNSKYAEELPDMLSRLIMLVKQLAHHTFDPDNTLVRFMALLDLLNQHYNFSFEVIYKLYIGKNILNIFRTSQGYAEGTYKKLWNGVEDNVVLQAILNNISIENLKVDSLLALLTIEYNR